MHACMLLFVWCRKHWLSEVGSKNSRIERCLFKDEKTISNTEYRTFDIKK